MDKVSEITIACRFNDEIIFLMGLLCVETHKKIWICHIKNLSRIISPYRQGNSIGSLLVLLIYP